MQKDKQLAEYGIMVATYYNIVKKINQING